MNCELVPSSGWVTSPLTSEFLMTRPLAPLVTSMSQLMVLLSMTTFAVVMVQGPVYVRQNGTRGDAGVRGPGEAAAPRVGPVGDVRRLRWHRARPSRWC